MASWAKRVGERAGSDERFNFHREEEFALAEEFLREGSSRDEGPSVVLLSADGRGAGRSYFLDALVERLGPGTRPHVWRLDLGGFEPDHPYPLVAYLGYQLDRRAQRDGRSAAVVETAKSLSRALASTEMGAILAALLLELENPLDALAELGGLAPASGIERLLGALAARCPVVLHVVDFAQLSGPTRRHLVAMAERLGPLFLALSCGFADRTARVAPGARFSVLRLEIEPLSQNELRQLVERRLSSPAAAESVSESLWRATAGAPARLGPRLEELVAEGALVLGENASWQLADEAAFADPGDQVGGVERALDALFMAHPDIAKALRSLLLYGSLCGEVFPPKVLLERMGLDEETADEVIDLVDETLVAQYGWIEDLEFRHPGFPGLQVYRIAGKELASAVLLRVGPEGASSAARVLLEALAATFPPFTRAVATLHLELSRHLGPAYQKPHLDLLSWWASADQQQELEAEVRLSLENDEHEAGRVWEILWRFARHWPTHRLRALLKAFTLVTLGKPLEEFSEAELARQLPQDSAELLTRLRESSELAAPNAT